MAGADIRKEPTVPSFTHPDAIFLGLDVHRDSISAGVLHPGDHVPVVEKISADEGSVRRLLQRFEDPRSLRACYEVGPTGYDLCRLLRSMAWPVR
jgi:transposase